MSKYLGLVTLIILMNMNGQTQQSEAFEIISLIPTTSLKDQQSSGTCWSFATTSFIETEAIRLGHNPVSLSPIFYVTPTYIAKAEKYIETKGKSFFDPGDLTFSVLQAYGRNGAVPESIYDGIIDKDWQHDHVEMDNLLEVMVASIGASGYGRIKPMSWRKSIEGVLNAYLGSVPATFVYNKEQHTPISFAKKYVGINSKDYIEITSYAHLEFYKNSILEIPANWDKNKYLNLPIQDFEKLINNALKSGYSLAWDGDSSESGFSPENGIAELPFHQEKIIITQELRQSTFEDEATTDDHNMHIIGSAKDKEGRLYYIIKNSEGDNRVGGYMYMSKNYLLLKTISLLVHKDALPSETREKIEY